MDFENLVIRILVFLIFSHVLFKAVNIQQKQMFCIIYNLILTKNILFFLTAAGWVIFAFGVLQFPVWAIIVIIKKQEGSYLEVSYNLYK
jgi:hypothetical protein